LDWYLPLSVICAVFYTGFDLRGADLPFYSTAKKSRSIFGGKEGLGTLFLTGVENTLTIQHCGTS
jgi:hypothetical protein